MTFLRCLCLALALATEAHAAEPLHGAGATLPAPLGRRRGPGNEGVASLVQRTRAAIGYVAFSYARAHRLSDVALPSHEGAVVRAERASFEAALAATSWREPSDLARGLTNAPGARAWPIMGASYVLLPRGGTRATEAGAFVGWAWKSGGAIAERLGYVPLPADAVALARQAMR